MMAPQGAVARMKNGVTIAQANSELQTIAKAIERERRDANTAGR